MWLKFKSTRRKGGPGSIRTLGVVSLCALTICGYALGQTPIPAGSNADPKPAAPTTTKAKPTARTKPARATIPPPRTGATATPARVSASRRPAIPRKNNSDFKMDPNAKFVCENPVVTLEPVWRNGKDLTFPFKIRNEGTADLKIKAKGG